MMCQVSDAFFFQSDYSRTSEDRKLICKDLVRMNVDFALLKLVGMMDAKHGQITKMSEHICRRSIIMQMCEAGPDPRRD